MDRPLFDFPPFDVARAPYIDATRVNLLWIDDFYDVPRSGIAAVDGERCIYQWLGDDRGDDQSHRWALYRPTAAQLADEELWHARWEALFGVDLAAFYEQQAREYQTIVLGADQLLGWTDALSS